MPPVELADLVGGEDVLDRGQAVVAPGQARILMDLPRHIPAPFVAGHLGRRSTARIRRDAVGADKPSALQQPRV
jgi:hypothetical protein